MVSAAPARLMSTHGDHAARHRTSLVPRARLYDREAEADVWPRTRPAESPLGGAGLVLKEPIAWSTVLRMAVPQARSLSVRNDRALRRSDARARARRARRVALLGVLAVGLLVVALVAAFSGGSAAPGVAGPAPAKRLLPAGPPQPQVVALHESLRILLPVNQSRITAIGYHATGAGALPLEPVGTRANAGFFTRLARKLFGGTSAGLRYYLLEGGTGPSTGGLDVGAPAGTDVYAPVDGTVIAIADRIVNGQRYGVTIDIQPSGSPDLVVTLANLRPDKALTVGSSVSAARTKVGRIIDLSAVEQNGLARYTQDKGQHVHIDVHPAASLAAP